MKPRSTIGKCPVCEGPLRVTELSCPGCRTRIVSDLKTCEFCNLSPGLNTFLRSFLRARGNIKPLPGAIELLRSLNEHGFSQALGSSAPIENIRLVTQELGIEGIFQVIVSGRDVKEGKPSPQGFLLAAEKLGIEPQYCVVIEDATAGVAAAKRAGMRCLAVTNTSPKTKLASADRVVDTLEQVSVSDLASLLKHSRK